MDAPADMIPWEHRGKLGAPRAFWQTLVLSVREPRRFYALTSREDSIWGALIYGLVFDVVVSLASFVHAELVGQAEFKSSLAPLYPQLKEVFARGPELIERVTSTAAIGELVITPFAYVFNLFTTVAMTWVGLKLARGLTTSFSHLFRMFAYASWIQLFGLLSVPGDVFLGGLSALLILAFGSYYWLVIVRQTQRIDNTKAAIASLYGCLIAFTFCCIAGFPLMLALGWFVFSLLPPIAMPK